MLDRTPFRGVLVLGLPLVLAACFQFSFNLSEVWIFGHIPDRGASLAGAAASDIVTAVFALFASGLGNAAVAKISYCHGAGDRLGVMRHARQALFIGVVLSLLSAVVGLFAGPIGNLIMSDGAPQEAGIAFLRIMALGGFGTIFIAMAIAILRSQGDSVRPLQVVVFMSVGTLILEAIFVLGLFGVEPHTVVAAAWITVVIRAIAAIGGVWWVSRCISLRPPEGERFIDFAALKTQLRLGFVAALQQSVQLVGFMILLYVVAGRFYGIDGNYEYTAVNIWIKLEVPTILLAFAWGGSVSPAVGMGLGAGRPAFSRHAAWAGVFLGAILSLVTMAFVLTCSEWLVTLFVPTVPKAIALSTELFAFSAPVYPFLTASIIIAAAFNGAGDMRTPLLWDLFTILAIQSTLVVLLAQEEGMGIVGVGWAVLIGRILQGVVPSVLLYFSKWAKD